MYQQTIAPKESDPQSKMREMTLAELRQVCKEKYITYADALPKEPLAHLYAVHEANMDRHVGLSAAGQVLDLTDPDDLAKLKTVLIHDEAHAFFDPGVNSNLEYHIGFGADKKQLAQDCLTLIKARESLPDKLKHLVPAITGKLHDKFGELCGYVTEPLFSVDDLFEDKNQAIRSAMPLFWGAYNRPKNMYILQWVDWHTMRLNAQGQAVLLGWHLGFAPDDPKRESKGKRAITNCRNNMRSMLEDLKMYPEYFQSLISASDASSGSTGSCTPSSGGMSF